MQFPILQKLIDIRFFVASEVESQVRLWYEILPEKLSKIAHLRFLVEFVN